METEQTAQKESPKPVARHWTDRIKLPATALVILGASAGALKAGESSSLAAELEPPAITALADPEPEPDLAELSFPPLIFDDNSTDSSIVPAQESLGPDSNVEPQADDASREEPVTIEQEDSQTSVSEPSSESPPGQILQATGQTSSSEQTTSSGSSTAPAAPQQPDLWDKITKVGLAITTVALGVLSVAAALRGVIKGSIEVRLWRKSLKRFQDREFTDTAPVNAHSFIERDGKLVLEADTMARPLLVDFIGNRGARRYFLKAAKRCTHDQPLVCLEFPRDLDGGRLRRSMKRAIGKPLHYLTFKKLFKWAVAPVDPNLERFSALNRINKILREAVSGIYNQNNLGLTAKQFSKEVPYEFIEKEVVVVPIADTSKPEEKNRMTLILATIPVEDFERFGDPEERARMTVAGGIPEHKLRTLTKAYEESQRYKQYRDRSGRPQELFPKVRVYLPRPNIMCQHKGRARKAESTNDHAA